MPRFTLTCRGCEGRNLASVQSDEDFTVKREGFKVQMQMPLPMLCLDCGGTSHYYKKEET